MEKKSQDNYKCRRIPPLCKLCGKELTSKENINEEIRFDGDKLKQVATILSSKGHNNVAIIGGAGTGKTAMVSALAAEVAAGKYPALAGRRIVEVNIDTLLKDVHNVQEKGTRITNLLAEAERENIILFIDEGHRLYGKGEADNLGNIMKPSLTRDKLQVILATTIDEYYQFIAHDRALERRFERVLHKEPDAKETLDILKHVIVKRYPDLKAEDAALKELVDLGRRYISDRNNPDKSLALLDNAVAWDKNKSQKNEITCDTVREVLSKRIGVGKESMHSDIKSGLNGMEAYLKEKFPGWEEVCRKVTESLEKALTRKLRDSGPLSATVLCGPDLHLTLDIAKEATEKLGCVGEGSLYVIDVNRKDPADPYTLYVRKNPNAAVIFKGVSAVTPPEVFFKLRDILGAGSLKSDNGQTADYSCSNVFVLCQGETKKTGSLGFGSSGGGSGSIDGDALQVMKEAAGVDTNSVIVTGAPDKGKVKEIYDGIFLPLLDKSAKKCGCGAGIELAGTAENEMLGRLGSATAWSAMHDAVDEIVRAVITDGRAGTGRAEVEWKNGRFCVDPHEESCPER